MDHDQLGYLLIISLHTRTVKQAQDLPNLIQNCPESRIKMSSNNDYDTHHSLSKCDQGFLPVAHSKTTQPSDQMSIAPRAPPLSFLITSGDIYIGVPVKLLVIPRLLGSNHGGGGPPVCDFETVLLC